MVASAMFFSVSIMGAVNNNQIGLEEAKFLAEHNISLRNYGELNSLVPINNQITTRYSALAMVCFFLSIVFGFIAVGLVLPRRRI